MTSIRRSLMIMRVAYLKNSQLNVVMTVRI